jgi:aspartyl-tRNA(Asn)/glutamyl-tRNA(Gln) amidotransferase subunit A
MNDELHLKTLAELAALIRARRLSPVELTDAVLARIAAFDPQVNAFITVTAEVARVEARRAEAEITAGRYLGPLHGIPFALKDIYNTRGILTTAHSRTLIGNIPAEDAGAVQKLQAAGAVLAGKLSTHEFAHGGPSFDLPWPPARNPWNLAHFTGGSSSGAGAAIAARLVPAALGSDTGGSIRTPSAFCGVAGLKPTYGRVSRHGVLPNSFTLDHCGPLAWTVEDCAIILQAIAGYDARDPASADRAVPDYRAALRRDLNGLRVGVVRHWWEEELKVNAELARATDSAIDTLKQLGATIENVRLRPTQEYHDVKTLLSLPELFSIYQDDLITRPGDFGADFLGRGSLAGCLFQAADYMHAQRIRRRMLEEASRLYAKFDVLVTAGVGPAPRLDAHRTVSFWENSNICSPFSVLANPVLMVCSGFCASGLPLGLQIGGRPFDEATVLRTGHAYERATQWRARQAPLTPGAVPPPVTLAPPAPVSAEVTAAMRDTVRALTQQAGLTLNDAQFDQLLRAAPHAFAMMRRIRETGGRDAEPANTFRFDATTS